MINESDLILYRDNSIIISWNRSLSFNVHDASSKGEIDFFSVMEVPEWEEAQQLAKEHADEINERSE